MTRACSVCGHSDRAAIDAAMAENMPYRTIAQQYGVSPYAITRHKKHIAAAMAQAQEATATTAGAAILAKIQTLEADARRLQEKAERSGDIRTAISALREMVRIVELLAKLQGELHEGDTINIILSPQWITIRAVIVGALATYPEARARVVEALQNAGA